MTDIRLLTKKLFGFTDDPDGFKPTSEILFYFHRGKDVLIGDKVSKVDAEDGEELYIHTYRKFRPDTNFSDAWIIVNKMVSLEWGYEISGNGFDKTPIHLVIFGKGDYDGHEDKWEEQYLAGGLNVCELICEAALKAISEQK